MRCWQFALGLFGALVFAQTANAHCDAEDGPVATAALKALDTKNVNLILSYAPAKAEPALTTAFEEALAVRVLSPRAKALADRAFTETAVRLHREGEGAAYTGLKPAGTDFGPAIPAAEQTIETRQLEPLVKLLAQAVEHGLAERFEQTAAKLRLNKEPGTQAEVQAARERVSAELEFIGYAESIYLAVKAGGHGESHREGTSVVGGHRE
jgi:hypothetical protein